MNPICCSLGALAVALCYLFARAYRDGLERRQRTVRQRVAYLLWTIANRAGECEPLVPSH